MSVMYKSDGDRLRRKIAELECVEKPKVLLSVKK